MRTFPRPRFHAALTASENNLFRHCSGSVFNVFNCIKEISMLVFCSQYVVEYYLKVPKAFNVLSRPWANIVCYCSRKLFVPYIFMVFWRYLHGLRFRVHIADILIIMCSFWTFYHYFIEWTDLNLYFHALLTLESDTVLNSILDTPESLVVFLYY